MFQVFQIGNLILNSSAVDEMRGHPDHKNWRQDLVTLGRADQLAPLAEGIASLTETNLSSPDRLNAFLAQGAQKIPIEAYLAGGEVAESALTQSPNAAFLLAWLCLMGWANALGDKLYAQYEGVPHFGWARIPYACAHAAVQIGAIDGGKALADEAYEFLMSAKYWMIPENLHYLEAYREISATSLRKYEVAIANLADDLRDSCQPAEHHFRPEVGALLWSFGLVPESRLFQNTASPVWVPSRRLFVWLVRHSLQCMPHDPLIQYLWLELKDRPPFSVRNHKLLFHKINAEYHQSMLDAFAPTSPSEAYARTLIGWFRGDLSSEQARQYMEAYEIYAATFPSLNWVDYIRMTSLTGLILKRFGWLKPDMTEEEELKGWYELADVARRSRRGYLLHPDWPEIYGRPNAFLFHIFEKRFAPSADGLIADGKEVEDALHVLEDFRSTALAYWMRIVPPLPARDEQEVVKLRSEEEGELLSYLRGAYFQILSPILPWHYRRYTAPLEELQADEKEGWKLFDPEGGRQQFKKLFGQLEALYTDLQAVAPRYANKRLNPTVGLSELITAISSHSAADGPGQGK